MLIWSLIFIRAFGMGPFSGILAIGVTDTGTLGKLMSESIENIDKKEMEGVKSTGANSLQQKSIWHSPSDITHIYFANIVLFGI